jgi:hypothetical protein
VRESSDDPAAEYTRFALAANDMPRSVAWRDVSFAERGIVDPADSAWRTHLTTLFPEVRPRGHFEVRSCDAIDDRWYGAPIVFLAGLAYDDIAAREASILAAESRALLRTAGESALRDASIARTSRDLFQLALAGARRLGDAYCGGAAVETATEFFATYGWDRSPADDRVLPEASALVNAGFRRPLRWWRGGRESAHGSLRSSRSGFQPRSAGSISRWPGVIDLYEPPGDLYPSMTAEPDRERFGDSFESTAGGP